MTRFQNALQAFRELGFQKIGFYALYQLGMKTGYWKRITPSRNSNFPIEKEIDYFERFPWKPPAPTVLKHIEGLDPAKILADADLIVSGKIKFFNGKIARLKLSPPNALRHWSEIEDNDPHQDIKFIWEPARFSWAYTLCRAYLLSGADQYAEAFWGYVESFIDNNPVNKGPNWASGQEIALRLNAWIFCGVAFKESPSSTTERKHMLIAALADHAVRLPKTLIYARAQNNNHLITEAAGMFTAGIFFQNNRWKFSGWRWLETAIQRQVDEKGTYIQQSTNYHRLMLQSMLWVNTLRHLEDLQFSPQISTKLAGATQWLLTHLDPISGKAPNLGHNDGSLIMPLASCEVGDYRPTAQASALAFLEQSYLPAGPWDEYSAWLGLERSSNTPLIPPFKDTAQTGILRIGSAHTWAILRAEKYTDRPAHADQLHMDLWWEGENIGMDPGTYRYTAPEPWGNSLAHTAFHNTIEIDGQDQMQRASRFLWLHWAQAQPTFPISNHFASAKHDGYHHLGTIHERRISFDPPAAWTITDAILPGAGAVGIYKISLHWLLPDWDWNLIHDRLILQKDQKQMELWVTTEHSSTSNPSADFIQIVRAGKVVAGPVEERPVAGWFSPTYDVKVPALSLRCVYHAALPFQIKTYWTLKQNQFSSQ